MIKELFGVNRVDEGIRATYKKRILVYGSRGIALSTIQLQAALIQWPFTLENICLISGGAIGPDRTALDFANEFSVDCLLLNAKWNEFGKSAGMRRNREMGKIAQYACGFWDGKSPGTAGMTDILRKKNIPLILTIMDSAVRTLKYDKLPKGI